MKISRFISIGILALCPAAHGQVNTPKVGMVRQADGSVHALYGIHANFVLGPALYRTADSASFSEWAGIINVKGLIKLIVDGQVAGVYSSHDANALVNIDGEPGTAVGWVPAQQALLHWNGGGFDAIAVDAAGLPGAVKSVQLQDSRTARLILSDATQSYKAAVSLENGAVESVMVIAGAGGFAFEQQGYLLFHDDSGLQIQEPNGARRTLNIHETDVRFERMAGDWLHLRSESSKRDWALHLSTQTLELAELPAGTAHIARRAPIREVRK